MVRWTYLKLSAHTLVQLSEVKQINSGDRSLGKIDGSVPFIKASGVGVDEE